MYISTSIFVLMGYLFKKLVVVKVEKDQFNSHDLPCFTILY